VKNVGSARKGTGVLKNTKPIEIIPYSYPWVSIMWQVSNWCNYRCTYCNDFNHGGDYKNNDEENIKKSLDNISKLIEVYKNNGYNHFKILITGGEPTFWKGLIPVIKKIKNLISNEGNFISINTNLSRNINWWGDNYNLFDEVIASYHPGITNCDDYVKKFQFLQNKIECVSRIMMKSKYFDECINIGNIIKNTCDNYYIEYSPVLSTLSNNVHEYQYVDSKELDFFKTYPLTEKKWKSLKRTSKHTKSKIITSDNKSKDLNINETIGNKLNTFYNWNCNIFENLYIQPNGDIQQSTCGQGNNCGNIFSNIDTQQIFRTTVCKNNFCHCGADIHNSKSSRIRY